ncbi:molybdopterin cofactor-binding domain-containing protein [Oceanicoccus sp. KOV_DT_Chl]|uniref:molybdopterin cofactor-binding domain-containing protein n=1 Tax=Oceanicoccus sp. KOV_DT_Chl TaxID=1904639 RepID=UPI00350F1115
MLPAWVPTEIARSLGKFVGKQAGPYDITTAEGAKVPYNIPNLSVAQIYFDPGIKTGFWRSVGYSHNCFVVESFIDEVANAGQQDPLLFRQQLLDPASRHAAVLALAAEKANWGNPNKDVSQGLAVVDPFESYCAMVAEVTVSGASYKIERILAAVDCGLVINPDIVKTQVEGAIIYALTAATKPPVTIADGRVVESNFHDLPVMRMNEIPVIEVHIIASEERPSGIGEIGVPAVAPAIANALFAATGQRLRQMPLLLS